MDCPRCKLVNPATAERCDCGYDFGTGTMKTSYLNPAPVPSEGVRQRGRRDMPVPFPVDVKFIRAAEENLGVRFPAGFVGRMTRLNGGTAQVAGDVFEVHPIFDSSDRKRAARTSNDVCRETAYMRREWPDFPQDAVVVAQNGSGDRLVMFPDPTPGALGQPVFHWDHETGEVVRVVDDFADLPVPTARAGRGAKGERA